MPFCRSSSGIRRLTSEATGIAPVDASLIAEVCRILTQYEELRLTRLQVDPIDETKGSVRWGQCQ